MNLLRLSAGVLLIIHMMVLSSSPGGRGAIEVIENLHTTLLAVMKNGDEMGYRVETIGLNPKSRPALTFLSLQEQRRVGDGRPFAMDRSEAPRPRDGVLAGQNLFTLSAAT